MLRALTAVAIPAIAIIADAPITTVTGFRDADSVSFAGALVVFTMVQEGSTVGRWMERGNSVSGGKSYYTQEYNQYNIT
jgi:hypothetical protein